MLAHPSGSTWVRVVLVGFVYCQSSTLNHIFYPGKTRRKQIAFVILVGAWERPGTTLLSFKENMNTLAKSQQQKA